jgi:futalosine hydrolase
MVARMLRHLILVPTDRERRILRPLIAAGLEESFRIELCGFGPVAAAARTAQLVAEQAAPRVILVGIAGRLDDRLAVGSAYRFERVASHGIGAGSGDGFVPAQAMGWPQWPGDPADEADRIGDLLPCTPGRGPGAARAGLLLTTCAASATAEDVRQRLRLFPEAAAEDMEGFGVALACRLRGVAIDIVRGISNTAGDRDQANWRVEAALEAAAALALAVMAGDS